MVQVKVGVDHMANVRRLQVVPGELSFEGLLWGLTGIKPGVGLDLCGTSKACINQDWLVGSSDEPGSRRDISGSPAIGLPDQEAEVNLHLPQVEWINSQRHDTFLLFGGHLCSHIVMRHLPLDLSP